MSKIRTAVDLLRRMRTHTKANDHRKQWAFMEGFEIPDAEDPSKTYLWRLRVIQTPLGGLYLHRIAMGDGDRDLHDHPFPFAALVLAGGYTEEFARLPRPSEREWRPGVVLERKVSLPSEPILRIHRRGTFNRIDSRSAHRIEKLLGAGPTWTLVFVGPRVQVWGFWTAEGFVPWDQYMRSKNIPSHQPKARGAWAMAKQAWSDWRA